MTKAVVTAIALLGAACSNDVLHQDAQTNPSATALALRAAMPTAVHGARMLSVRYIGKWEFISHRDDGRYLGKSVRSFHPGDSVTIVFSGNRLRIYGICGPNGGVGSVVVPGKAPVQITFYAPKKQTHVMLYDTGKLEGSVQTAGVVVTAPGAHRSRGYVNIDEMEAFTQ